MPEKQNEMEYPDDRYGYRGRSYSSALQSVLAPNQDGGPMVCAELASDSNKDCPETLKSGSTDLKYSSSPSPYPKPMEGTLPLYLKIPRKGKEKRALFQYVSSESREYTDILKIITSGYKDSSSWGSYHYTKHCLVQSELLEKDFIEKRREMKSEGRSEKEMAESYCFLFCESYKLQAICDKGLHVGHSWMNLLGNPSKGVYLCKYSDLLQINPFEPGTTGEMIIFKVIKGKMKSICDNMSRSLDPTPKFDSHISKNFSRVASHRSYRAFEHTQQYFYEYTDVDVRPRPRHICPYAVVSFRFSGKEAPPLAKPMPLLRSNSFTGGKGRSSYVVWNGHLTNGGKELYQVSFRSLSQPILPFKLPSKVEIGTVMCLDQVKLKIPPGLFSWDLYSGSQEVFKKGSHCCLFEVVEKNKCGNSLTVLMYKLERERLVLVNSVTDRGFFFLLSSAQMANPSERRDGWKTSNLHALFVFPESRDVVRYPLKSTSTSSPLHAPQPPIQPQPLPLPLPQLGPLIPALHFALNKVRCTPQASPPANPSTAVAQQACDYLRGQREGKLLPRVHVDYDPKLDDRERLFPAPRNKLNLEAYLHSYIRSPDLYCIPVTSARVMMDSLPEPPECRPAPCHQLAADGSDPSAPGVDKDPEKVQQLLQLIQIQKQQAGKGLEASLASTLKRKREEDTAEGGGKQAKKSHLSNGRPREGEGDGLQAAPSLAEVISLVGLRDTDLRKNKTEGALKLMEVLDTISKRATGVGPSGAPDGGSQREAAGEGADLTDELEEGTLKVGMPINYDTDLRQQLVDKEDTVGTDCFESESTGSLSSIEAFSPCSDHGQQRGASTPGEKSIPWVLIPITGIKQGGYSQRQWDNPQDPRLLHTTGDSCEPAHETEPGTSLNQPEPVACYEEPPLAEMEEPLEETDEREESAAEKQTEKSDQQDPEEEKKEEEEEVVLEEKDLTDEVKPSNCQEWCVQHQSVVDSIVDEQLNDFSVEVTSLLKRKHVSYRAPAPAPPAPAPQLRAPMRSFSDYVARHHEPVPLYGFVRTLRNSLTSYIDSHLSVSVPEPTARASSALNTSHPSSPDSTPPSVSASALSTSNCNSRPCVSPAPAFHAPSSTRPSHTNHSSTRPSRANHSSAGQPCKQSHTTLPHLNTFKEAHLLPQDRDLWLPKTSECSLEEPDVEVFSGFGPGAQTPPLTDARVEGLDAETAPAACAGTTLSSLGDPSPSSLTNLINKLNPEMFTNLVEIIKGVRKNSVQFYIHSSDGEDRKVCTDIKEYLLRLGNAERSPQQFLERNDDSDKLLVIIPNEDIASEVHKIPALGRLKTSPFVSFAGVDSLDDIKNRTYNELFVSGGFVVSDKLVLNPDVTTQETLQKLLEFLQQVNTPESPWRWKVHCRTLKRLREQSRVRGEALGLLDLLTAYQKRHIVEFLPYHECDAPGSGSTDLSCLVKLQAQHTQYRHVIFLTERHCEVFQDCSSAGILVAAADDLVNNFNQLIGFHDSRPKVWENQVPHVTSSRTLTQHEEGSLALVCEEESSSAPYGAIKQKHLAPTDSCQLTPDQLVPDGGNSQQSPVRAASQELDFDALRSAIFQLKSAKASEGWTSRGPFNLNPPQSFFGAGLSSAPCTDTSEAVDSLTPSSSDLNARQTSEGHVDSPLQLYPTGYSQEDLGPQQVQETTTPTSRSGHTDTNYSDSSSGLGSNMLAQPQAAPGIPQNHTPAFTSGTSDSPAEGSVKTSEVNSNAPSHLNSNSGTLPNLPSVEDAENALAPGGPSVNTPSQSSVSRMELVPVTPLHSQQPEMPPGPAASVLTAHTGWLPHPEISAGLQAAGVWPCPQGPVAMNSLGHGLNITTADTMAAVMLGHVMGSTFGGGLGGGGLLPTPSMHVPPVAWNRYPRGGAAVNMWRMQQSLQRGQMHHTQFIQGFTLRGDFPGQGNGYQPFWGGLQ